MLTKTQAKSQEAFKTRSKGTRARAGAGALAAAADDGIISPHLMLLGAMLALLLAMAPLVAATALKIGETESGI